VTFATVGGCNWQVPTGLTKAWVVAVGGGGAAGAGSLNNFWGAGGGGGEVISTTSALAPGGLVPVVVGAGGITTDGSQSSFGTVVARAGKTPINTTSVGGVSGSGTAGGTRATSAATTTGNGGGGAQSPGVGINPGAGIEIGISGTTLEYGGGGNGYNTTGTPGTARSGAGTFVTAALANRGGGGSQMSGARGAGGSGVVIVRYKTLANSNSPTCNSTVGFGGVAGVTTNQAGHGCVIIAYTVSGSITYQTFNYTGSDQSWTSPAATTELTFYLVGAGGGAINAASRGPGGSGGFATASYTASSSTVFKIIVGQGGNGTTQSLNTYGGGGKADYGSGGGRSAIRIGTETEDLLTAGGGGGGGYDAKCGGAGGGTTGQDAVIRTSNGEHGKGGTQTAGGAGGYSVNNRTGGTGIKYQGGLGQDDSGGGGGGYWGGGGGGDNIGAGGGSGYFDPSRTTNATLTQGTCDAPGNSGALAYEVNYNGNGSTAGTEPAGQVVSAFSPITTAANSGSLARTGFTFAGWNTAANGSGTTHAAGTATFTPRSDTILYAQWNSTITYNANGATGTAPTAVTTTTDASRTFNLNSGSGLTRTGLGFAGWNTAADGTGTQVAGGASYTSTGSATLFAIFRPTYTYNANGATGGTVPPSTLGPIPGTQCVTDPGFNNCRVVSYTGTNQTFTVPSDIDATKGIMVEAWGAGGAGTIAYYGDPSGGAGGYSKAKINSPTAGSVLTVVVGQGGLVRDTTTKFGGGGAAGAASGANLGSSGGGYSGVFLGSGTSTPILISGGGGAASPGSDAAGRAGGGGAASTDSAVQNGGQSSGTNSLLAGGRGGTNTAGGAGATSNSCATAGSSLLGGTGCAISGAEGGSGGGGGYFGGGGGAYQTSTSGINGGGGGGSGFLNTTLATSVAAVKGPDGVFANFAFADRTSPNYASNAGRGGMPNTNTAADNTGGNGLVTIQWSSTTTSNPVASNTGSLVRTGYRFAGWNTSADGNGTSVPVDSTFPSSTSVTLFAAWEPDNTGLTPSFNTNISDPIGVLANTAYVINTVYTNSANDLILSQYVDKIQIIASVPSGTLAITTTTNLTLPIGYQSALNTAAGTISFVGNLADVNAALATLRYTAPATAVNSTITITASYAGLNGDYRYNAATGSYYWRGATAVARQAALDPTTASSNCGVKFNGMCGYMTIPNNGEESLFIFQKLGAGWIGISKPNHPTFQYVANAPNGSSATSNFYSGEGGISSEPNIAIWSYGDGKWVDLSTQTVNAIYEFGGKSETVLFGVLTRTITIGALVATGTPTLDSASDTGTSSTDKITKDNTPTINIGGLTSGATITLTAKPASGSSVTCTFVATSTTGSCTFPTMADGTYSITTTQTLGGTTTAASAALSNVVIDATRPTVRLSSSNVVSGGNLTATPSIPTVSATITVTFSESVSGLLISEISKNVESAGWAITTTAFTNAAISSINFVAANATGAGGTAGIARFSVAEGVASDVAGNTNTGTIADFIINTLIQLTLTNQYQAGINPVVGGNTTTVTQATSGQALDISGQGGVTRANHTFAGWSLTRIANGSDEVLPSSYTPTVPRFLYSSWVANVYVVSYNANGGNGAPGVASENYTFGTTGIAITSTYNIGTLSRTGYTFAGWSTTPTGAAVANPYVPTASVTLFARWTAGNFTLTLDRNGSTGTAINGIAIVAGTAKSLSGFSYSRDGYTFLGWNSLANGTGTSYPIDSSVTFFGNTTLYAKWGPRVPGVPSVGISGSPGNTQITVAVTGATLSGTVGPASSYVVTASPGSTSCTITVPATTCTFTGLTNGTAYTFTAVATNATGSSVASASSASATPAPFLVTYEANGGTVSTATDNFNLGTPIALPLPVRNGYVFAGWKNPSNVLVGLNEAAYSPASAITLTAQWTPLRYIVSYNGNGSTSGSVPTNGSFDFGSSLTVAEKGTLARVGYTFAGWKPGADGSGVLYANASDSMASSTATYSTAANLTLYAQWSAAARTLTYALDSGTATPSLSQVSNLVVGNTVTLPTSNTITRTGFTFAGWSDGSLTYSGGARWTVPASDSNFTLTAQWTTQTLSFSYDTNGGGTAPNSGTIGYGQTITLAESTGLSKAGFTFGGWRDESTTRNPGDVVTVTASKIFVAQWSPRSYTIKYNGNSSTSGSMDDGSYIMNGTPHAIQANGFSKTGYTFNGWKTAADGTGNSYLVGAGYTTAAPLDLFAQWSPASYVITYNANGSTGGTVPETATVTTGVAFNTATNAGLLVKTGYSFGGWNTAADASGTSYNQSAPLTATANLTLFAVWNIISPTILFSAGLIGSTIPAISLPNNTNAVYRSLFTLPSSDTATVVLDANYRFKGWSDGSNTYQVGDSYRMSHLDVTFTAQWVAVYTVSYVLNGGEKVNQNDSLPGGDLRADGFKETLTNIPLRKPGHKLVGWKDQAGLDISAGSEAWTIGVNSFIAYAQWESLPRRINFDVNGATSGSVPEITGKYANETVALPSSTSISKTGYSFGGWKINPTYPAAGTYTVPADDCEASCPDITFTAVWAGNANTISYNANGATSGTVPANGSYVTGASSPYTVSTNSGNLVKAGFEFIGWYTTASGSGGNAYVAGSGTLTTTNDLTLYAQWSPGSYAVTFDKNNGETVAAPTSYINGSSLTLPAAPVKTGSNFLGWQLGSGSTANLYAAESTFTMGSSAITFVAQYTAVKYVIVYALNGGTGATPTQADVTSGDSFTTAVATDISRSGFNFDGWSTGTTTVAGNIVISAVSDNMTLTAQWVVSAPAAPTISTVVATDAGATITVAAGVGGGTPSSYTVTAKDGSGNSVGTCTIISPAVTCSVSPLVNGSPYTFTISASNSTGTTTGATSSVIKPAGAPDAPSTVIAVIGNGSASVSFTAPTSNGGAEITSYTVTAKDSSGNTAGSCQVNAPALTCVVSGLTNGTAYTFEATANNGVLVSNPSTPSLAVTPATIPDSPTSVSATSTASGTATVTFTAPSSTGGSAITGYVITSSPSGATCTVGADATTYTCAGLTDGTSYIFAVQATNTAGSSLSPALSSSVTPQGAASAVTTISATTGDSSALVTLSGSVTNGSTITGYTVQAYDSTGTAVPGSTCTVTTSLTSGSCTVTGLTNGSEYTFKAVTNSTANASSVTSVESIATLAVIPAKAPDAPTGVTTTAGTGKITVAWTEPTDNGAAITSYTVTSSPGGFTCTVSATTCEISTGLVAGTAYTFTVTATSLAGTSSASTASGSTSINAAPSVPLNAIAEKGNTTATVRWDAPIDIRGSEINGYTVTAYSSNNVASGSCTTVAPTQSCDITGLTNGSPYTFKVTATNGIGTSAASAASAAVTPSTVPDKPTAVTAVVGDTQATISFTGPVNNGGAALTTYTVTSNPGSFTCTINAPTTSCNISGLSNGTAYTFTVKASNTNGDSSPSDLSSSITPAKAPDAPTNVLVVAGTGKITVSWIEPASNGSPITSYTVQAYDSSGTAVVGATCVVMAPAVTCDVSANLIAGSQYTFKVTATSTAGTSLASDASADVAINAAPSVPINVTAIGENGSATVSWDPPVNTNGSAISGYTVTAYTLGNVVSGTCTRNEAPLTCSISGLTNGVDYRFAVTATNGIGTSLESELLAAATPSTVPDAPTVLSVAVGNTEATISFTPPSNNGGSPVTIYRVTASNGASATGTSSPIEMVGLTNGTAYTFTVTATNKNGESVASTASNPVTPADTFAPTLSSGVQPTGNPYVGSVLTSVMTFNGAPDPTLTYQWKSCTSPVDPTTCTDITGATSRTLLLSSAEEGRFVVVTVLATNIRGSESATSDPTEVINPAVSFIAPSGTQSGTVGTPFILSLAVAGGIGTFSYTVSAGTMPAGVSLDPATGQISGTPTTAGTYTFTVRAADSNGVFKEVVVTIKVAAASVTPTCGAQCQAALAASISAAKAEAEAAADKKAADDAARIAAEKATMDAEAARIAAEAKALADKKAADDAARIAAEAKALADKKAADDAARIAAEAKALADKKAADDAARIAAEKAAAEKLKSDAAANAASLKAKAEAEAAIIAAKAAVEKAAAAEVAKIAADAAALAAATKAKAAADAQAAADKAAATAASILKKSSTSAATKAAATKSAQKAVADAATAVKAAVKAAQVAATAKKAAANANKQVDIAINSLNSKTAAAKTQAQANAIAAAAKAAANEAAAIAVTKAVEAKATATAAQKAASDTAARIATEQKEASASSALAKIAADEFTKATAEKISATTAAKIASEALLKALEEKANLADQAVKATDSTTRSEIEKKIEELTVRITQAQKISEEADTKAERAAATQEVAAKKAESTKAEAEVQAAEAVAVKSESVTKTAAAVKAAAAAVVAAKVATAAKEAAAKVPSKAVISTKPSTSTKKNSATATVTGLKPGQKVKVTVNVRPKP
jgi:uncharacterized repeat protein (TIGR02543 family)